MLGAYAAVEVVLSAWDAYDTYQTITSDCATTGEKWAAGGLFTAGVFLPGNYRWLGNAVNSGAESAKQAANLKEHLRQADKYGKGGVKDIQNGRTRYYGETIPANKSGEMAGRRTVREWDPSTGNKRTWHETLDHNGNVRQVRPEFNNGTKTHYTFDKNGNFTGSW